MASTPKPLVVAAGLLVSRRRRVERYARLRPAVVDGGSLTMRHHSNERGTDIIQDGVTILTAKRLQQLVLAKNKITKDSDSCQTMLFYIIGCFVARICDYRRC